MTLKLTAKQHSGRLAKASSAIKFMSGCDSGAV